MSITLINKEKEEKSNKTYFLRGETQTGIEKLKNRTRSVDYDELFGKMIYLTNLAIDNEVKAKKGK